MVVLLAAGGGWFAFDLPSPDAHLAYPVRVASDKNIHLILA
jgi:hypothetical protein